MFIGMLQCDNKFYQGTLSHILIVFIVGRNSGLIYFRYMHEPAAFGRIHALCMDILVPTINTVIGQL